jgi:hypothetical protein
VAIGENVCVLAMEIMKVIKNAHANVSDVMERTYNQATIHVVAQILLIECLFMTTKNVH